MAEICLGLIVLGLTAYAVLGGADFGAGFWDLTAGGDRRGGRVRGLVQRSMSPVWEANHVWLIFVLVIAWTAFPVAFGAIFTTLAVPLFLAALGIILRGTAFALRGQAATIREARLLGAMFALSSVLLPFFFGAALGGDRVRRGSTRRTRQPSPTRGSTPTSIAIGVLAVLTGAYLAAVFLAGDARRAGAARPGARVPHPRARRRRRDGRGGVGALLVLRSDARPLFDGLTSGGGLVGRARLGARRGRDARAGRGPGASSSPAARRPPRSRAMIVRLVARDPARPAARAADDRRGGGAGRDADRARGQRRARAADPRAVAVVPLPARARGHARPGATSRSTSASGRSAGDEEPLREAPRPARRARAASCSACALMIPFETTVTRVLGVAALFAAIVVGVFAIASPEFLGDGDATPRRVSRRRRGAPRRPRPRRRRGAAGGRAGRRARR